MFSKSIETLNIPKWLWIASFAYICVVACLIQFLILPVILTDWHGGNGLLVSGDWLPMHDAAAAMAEKIRNYGWSEWTLWPPPRGWIESGIAGTFYAIFTSKPWVLIPFNAIIHATSVVLLYLILLPLAPSKRICLWAVIPYLMFPTNLLWNCQIHKDGAAILGGFLFIYGWVKIANFSEWKESWRHLWAATFYIATGTLVLAFARPYLIEVLYAFSLFLAPLTLVITIQQIFRKNLNLKQGLKLLVILLITLELNYTIKSGETGIRMLSEEGQVLYEQMTKSFPSESPVAVPTQSNQKSSAASSTIPSNSAQTNSAPNLETPKIAITKVIRPKPKPFFKTLHTLATAEPPPTTRDGLAIIRFPEQIVVFDGNKINFKEAETSLQKLLLVDPHLTSLPLQPPPKVFLISPPLYSIKWIWTPQIPKSLDQKLFSLAEVRRGFLNYLDAKSNMETDSIFHSAPELFRYLPRALEIGLFTPYPKQWFEEGSTPTNTVFRRFVGMEMLFFYAIFPFFIFTIFLFYKRLEYFIIFSYSVGIILLYSIVSPNFGTLHRFRYGCSLIMVGLGIIGLSAFKQKYWVGRRLVRGLQSPLPQN